MGWLKRIWLWIRKKIGCLFRVKAMEQEKIVNGNCWVAYFDILGFKNQVLDFHEQNGSGNLDVFVEIYYEILRYIENELRKKKDFTPAKFDYICSSDAFLFFACDDSIDSYRTIDRVARFFFRRMIWKRIPFRGALTVGDFYADKQKSVFVGQALIDAYRYAEKQNWIGSVMTPNACEKLCGTTFDLRRRSDYKEYDVPIKRKEIINGAVHIKTARERLFAHRINKYPGIEKSIMQMQGEAKVRYGKDYEAKYDNTLAFLRTTRLRACSSASDDGSHEDE